MIDKKRKFTQLKTTRNLKEIVKDIGSLRRITKNISGYDRNMQATDVVELAQMGEKYVEEALTKIQGLQKDLDSYLKKYGRK